MRGKLVRDERRVGEQASGDEREQMRTRLELLDLSPEIDSLLELERSHHTASAPGELTRQSIHVAVEPEVESANDRPRTEPICAEAVVARAEDHEPERGLCALGQRERRTCAALAGHLN
jgi:hypothetical protein